MATDKGPSRLVMNVEEAGKLLGLSRRTAYVLASEGAFPTIRLRGRILVPKERFMKWINGEGDVEPRHD